MTQKIVQYLDEARASEVALVRVLQSQIAMTPRGSYRTALEAHLGETRDHARRVERRLAELGGSSNPLQAVVGAAETVLGQALALTKTPLDLLRGSGGEEKVLKNAKDASATEALEIATYTAIERLAKRSGDEETARLAASIRADEERMLDRILRELPKLTDAVVDGGSYELAGTGAGEAVQAATGAAERAARQVPGVAQAASAIASADDLALRGDEPWPGYDELNANEVVSALENATDEQLGAVRDYERAHKGRTTVLRASERRLTHA
jgi:ferritin-like metal-binding protein YciE